ncbi:hypothetical protein N7532_009528 [Penicillium argentinense]|uniref:Uncharacterized protein n=1 Tax=Penicillium argentinense TaxID=1131581 RepID=A0A9W9EZF1_9EURO|nr:uncharacterized protein N7532_009528 [Penicillium argentinense]KAJ5090844.1 hypothetical protein N7532_009528 [Penicillium argentinense]
MKFFTLALLALVSIVIASSTPAGSTIEKRCNCIAELACKDGCRVFAGLPAGHVSEAFCELGCTGASGCGVNKC